MKESDTENKSFFNNLREKYPHLFYQDEDSQMPVNLFGLETNPGWDSIIESMCELMYRKYKSSKISMDYYISKAKENENNAEFLQKMKEDLEKVENEIPKICQIKEKFGGLRVYVDNLTPYVDGIIDMAEAMADITCEKCGNRGKTYQIGWHTTLCLEHARQRYGKLVDIPEKK